MNPELDAALLENRRVVRRGQQRADGAAERDRRPAELVVADGRGGLESEILPTDSRLRREVRRVVAERALDRLDGISELVFLVGSNRDEHPLVEDVRAVLDGLVRRCGLVGALLEIRAPDTLFEVSIHLKVVSDVLQFVPGTLLILRRDVGRQIELDVGHLEEVAQIPIVGIVGIVSDVQCRRPLLADPCGSRFPLDSSGRGHRLV